MSNGFNLDDDDVVSMEQSKSIAQTQTSTVHSLLWVIRNALVRITGIHTEPCDRWIESGLPCEVLQPGEAWNSGTIRIRLEFIPDEPEEELQEAALHPPSHPVVTLDDLRSQLLTD